MSAVTQQAIAKARQGAPDGCSNAMMLVARMLAEIVEQNDEIILTLSQ